MVWKVRGDCTYTVASNKTARQTAVEAIVPNYPTAIFPTYAATIGRFAGGVVSQSSTRFTVAYDFPDQATAVAFKDDMANAMRASTRSATLISVHDGE